MLESRALLRAPAAARPPLLHASSHTHARLPFNRPARRIAISAHSRCSNSRSVPESGQGYAGRLQRVVHHAVALLLAVRLVHDAPTAAIAAETFQGVPRIIDGDTLVVDGKKVRLFGVDAPESKQSCQASDGSQYLCGRKTADQLQAKLGTSPVRCETKAKDQYNREVAVCRTDSFELNRWLVESGLAVAYRQYAKDYVEAEEAAHAAKRGIWAGAFDIPADWRKERKIEQLERSLDRQRPTIDASLSRSRSGGGFAPKPKPAQHLPRQASDVYLDGSSGGNGSSGDGSSGADAGKARRLKPSAPAAPPACPNVLIKGNISSKGEKIFHVPGSRAYTTVQIDASRGERYFCSEAEAQAAGWRAAK